MAKPKVSAFHAALREAQTPKATSKEDIQETVKPLNGDAPKQPNSNTAQPQSGKTVKQKGKTSFYLADGQEEKLEELAFRFLQQHGRRINRNEIVRHLIDRCTLESLEGL